MSGFSSSPFIRRLVTGGFPAESVYEYLLENNFDGSNVLALQNNNIGGYSAITFRDYLGYERMAIGHGNNDGQPIFADRTYIEAWSGTNSVDSQGVALPREFVFTADGIYGRDGTVGNFRFFQRYTVNHLGTQFWRGNAYNALAQSKIAAFHEGGCFLIANTAIPNAIDILKNEGAFWWDGSAGAVKLMVRGRDTDGLLMGGDASAALAAITPTAGDTFAGADSATSITAGRAADTGGNWAAADADNWGIASNKAYRSSGSNDSWCYLASGIADVCVECDITLSATRALAGLMFRGVDASNGTYVQLNRQGSSGTNNSIAVYVNVSGTPTMIARVTSQGLALNTTYRVRVGAVGNRIFVYVDDVLKFDCESSTHKTSGTKQGLWSSIGGSFDDGGTTFDNFKVYP